jgi:branched-chain amino acid transport system ATP-binding protein
MLSVADVHVYYGESHILQGVSLEVPAGKVVVLLGRNGAGKTTTLRAIMGLTPARTGRIAFEGREITGLPAYRVARTGVGFAPSGRRLFGDLTVRQNLDLADARRRGRGRSGDLWTVERIFALFPKLVALAERPARTLSGGEQQMLKIGRCLLGNPRLLLLDEPTEGLAPQVVRQVMETLHRLKELGLSMLICEQNAHLALSLADNAYLLEKGVIRFSGPPATVTQHPSFHDLLAV